MSGHGADSWTLPRFGVCIAEQQAVASQNARTPMLKPPCLTLHWTCLSHATIRPRLPPQDIAVPVAVAADNSLPDYLVAAELYAARMRVLWQPGDRFRMFFGGKISSKTHKKVKTGGCFMLPASWPRLRGCVPCRQLALEWESCGRLSCTANVERGHGRWYCSTSCFKPAPPLALQHHTAAWLPLRRRRLVQGHCCGGAASAAAQGGAAGRQGAVRCLAGLACLYGCLASMAEWHGSWHVQQASLAAGAFLSACSPAVQAGWRIAVLHMLHTLKESMELTECVPALLPMPLQLRPVGVAGRAVGAL